ncbi:MAG TPA: histidine phosphatase family protein [Glycomyces sp.]|nr:histidine phosphatase family protein [Glycomyces sp.]
MAVDLVYETHAITEDNERGIATGWLPGRLSARGREVAVELGSRYRDVPPAAVFTSDLHRATETARIAFEDTEVPVHHDPRLRECDYGDLNGYPVDQIAAVRADHIDRPFPSGQSYREVIDATREFLQELLAEREGQRILIIAHSANRWALEALLGGARIEDLVSAPFHWQPGWHYSLSAEAIDRAYTGGR